MPVRSLYLQEQWGIDMLDNGLDQCLKCTICNTACPVAGENPSFPGPKYAGPELARLIRGHQPPTENVLDYCSNCRLCELACPSGVPITELIRTNKQAAYRHKGLPLTNRLFARVDQLGRVAAAVAPLSNAMARARWVRPLFTRLGISNGRPLPVYHRQTFKAWFSKRPVRPAPKKIAYFVGCYANYNEPEVAKATVEILEHNGYQVLVPEQRCCGLPALANGDVEKARRDALFNLEQFVPLVEQGYEIVTACPSCALTLKRDYPETLKDRAAAKLSKHVWELGEFLRDLAEDGGLRTDFGKVQSHLAYHLPCHTRSQSMGEPWADVLAQVPGLQVEALDAGCCGLSGTYGFKARHYDTSMAIGQRVFAAVNAVNPDAVVTECGTCALQINHGTGAKVVHPAILMREAYGRRESQGGKDAITDE